MKCHWIGSVALVLVSCSMVAAQTVSGTAPVVSPVEYTTSSSPIGNGKTVTTYYAPQQPTVTRVMKVTSVPQAVTQIPTQTETQSIVRGQNPEPYYNTQIQATGPVPVTPAPTMAGYDPCACSPQVYRYAPQMNYQSGYANQYFRPQTNSNIPAGVYFGQGIIGQPKAYVNDQPLRNALRFFTP